MTRKEELQEELSSIKAKELELQLAELDEVEGSAFSIEKIESARADRLERVANAAAERDIKIRESKSHDKVMFGDFILKFLIAIAVSAAFIYIIYTGSMASVEEELIGGKSKSSSLFNLLSVVGPLFGMVLQYYFGSKKAASNGE